MQNDSAAWAGLGLVFGAVVAIYFVIALAVSAVSLIAGCRYAIPAAGRESVTAHWVSNSENVNYGYGLEGAPSEPTPKTYFVRPDTFELQANKKVYLSNAAKDPRSPWADKQLVFTEKAKPDEVVGVASGRLSLLPYPMHLGYYLARKEGRQRGYRY